MKTLIAHDSVYGNTEKIARAVGVALGAWQVLPVAQVKPEHLAGLECLVVGSPTRAMRPTPAVMAFLRRLPAGSLLGLRTAAFDTRANVAGINSRILHFMVRVFGYAADPIAARLKRKGGVLAAPPMGFIVKGSEGPLAEGELERAAVWAGVVAASGDALHRPPPRAALDRNDTRPHAPHAATASVLEQGAGHRRAGDR